MTDHEDESTEPHDASASERPVASPKAQAASRARRIGGRPQPGPGTRTTPSSEAGPAVVSSSVSAGPTDAQLTEPAGVDAVTADRPAPPAPPPGQAAPAWLNWLPAAVLAVLIVVVLVLGVVASHGMWWANKSVDNQAERQQVLSAAKSCLATMNTYTYNKLDQAEAAGAACTTGKFTAQYKTAIEKVIKPQAAKVKFTQAATVNNAGIESVSSDGKQWVVLVLGQLSTTNSTSGTTTPELSIFSARATLQQVKGHWLIASYEYAPAS